MPFGDDVWTGIGSWTFDTNVQGHNLEPFSSRNAIALTQHDSLEPTGKSSRLAKLIQFLPGNNKGILGDIFSKISISEHGVGTGKRNVLKKKHQLGETLVAHRYRVA